MTAPTSSPLATPLQFDRAVAAVAADGSAPNSGVVCAQCRRTILSSYFTVAQKPFCGSCKAKIEWAVRGSKSTGAFMKAILFGLGAAVAGAMIYYGVIALLNLEIGIVAILIGYMVGGSIRKAASGGGRRYQILGAALTYFAVGLAYTPIAMQAAQKQSRAIADSVRTAQTAHTAANGATTRADAGAAKAKQVGTFAAIALVLFFIVALPVIVVTGSGAGGILSAIIIGFGIRQAWRMTAAANLAFVGPLKVAPAGAAPAAPA